MLLEGWWYLLFPVFDMTGSISRDSFGLASGSEFVVCFEGLGKIEETSLEVFVNRFLVPLTGSEQCSSVFICFKSILRRILYSVRIADCLLFLVKWFLFEKSGVFCLQLFGELEGLQG